MMGGKNKLEIIIAARDRTRAAFAKVNTQMRTLGGSSGKLNAALKLTGGQFSQLTGAAGKLSSAIGPLGLAAVAIAAGVAVVSLGVAAVKAFAEFEDAMANVRKTTGFTKSEIKDLGDAINTLALRIPVAQTELADIAAIAGQLGIQGKANILSFTEEVAKMSTAFDMPAEAAATAMAKMSNIYDIPIEQVSALGSAINALGNTTAAQESQIMAFSMSLGASAKMLGFCETESVAMGASLISMGMDASAAGTRLNSAFTQMGKNVGEVAAFLDMSEAEFKAAFGEDPMAMLIRITDKLSEIEDPLERNTVAAETFGLIGAKAINNLGADIDGLKTNLITAAVEFEKDTSLTEEFAAKTDTLTAKFAIFGNTVNSFKIQIGEALAPLAGTLVEGARVAIVGLGMAFKVLQEVIGAHVGVYTAFFGMIKESITTVFGPLIEKLKALRETFSDSSGAVQLFRDLVVITTTVARELGEVVGWVVSKALTPFADAIERDIDMLSRLYSKLGPLKEGVDALSTGIHDLAEAQRDLSYDTKAVMSDIDAMTASLEVLESSAVDAPTAILKAWKSAVDAFEDGAGSYKEAVSEIDKEIEVLIDLWKNASEEEKGYFEDSLRYLGNQKRALEDSDKAAREHLDTIINGTKKAIDKTKEFVVTIGDTTVSFKDAAVEVVKNADAYEKLQKSAQTLIDLDWSVFTEFEASLPNIEAGILDMGSAFVGLKGILEDNIESLENVQQSVMDISEIAAPFIEKGFQNSVKAIGDFAGALKDAGSAINTFSNLQDVSIDGAINFSLHVHDMVSALEILESQMEDLVPAFGDMDSFITDIAEKFVWTTGKKDTIADEINRIAYAAKDAGGASGELWAILEEVTKLTETGFRGEFAAPYIERYKAGVEDIEDITADFLASGEVLERQMGYTTDALRYQTEQLAKITNALQPYLEFMRTLNELAALSTLSTEELNSGLNSIKDTLINLGTVLSSFDLRSTMESLFGTKITEGDLMGEFTGGAATGFMDVMRVYEGKFHILIGYTTRLSFAISSLVSAFDSLAKISDSVLTNQTKLKKVFEDMLIIMSNFSVEMGDAGFADAIAKGMDAMIKSADPLMSYFDKKNASVIKFNNTLGMFKTTIMHVVDVMDLLKEMSEMVLPSVDELEAGFDKAAEAVSRFDKALLMHVEAREGQWDMGKYSTSIFKSVEKFAKDWDMLTKGWDDSFKSFEEGINTITTLISSIVSLSDAFKSMKDVAIPSATEMGAILGDIGADITEFTSVVNTEFPKITPLLTTFDEEWKKHKETIDETLPSLKEAINTYTTLISLAISLTRAYDSLAVKEGELAKIRVISAKDLAGAIKDIPAVISEMKGLLAAPVWSNIIDDLSEFAPKWDEISEGVKESIGSFSEAIGALSSIISAASQLTDTFTDMKDIVVISVDQMVEAFGDIPQAIDEVTNYLTTTSFENVKGSLKGVDAEWGIHKKVIDDTLPSFNSAIDTISTLSSKVLGLSSSLEELKAMTVLSVRDIDMALKNIPLFVDGFVDALALNMYAIKESLDELQVEWEKHAEEMKVVMPAYEDSTASIGTLISSLISLHSAMKSLSGMGTISEWGFTRGFEKLIESITNFATSFSKNAPALIGSLWSLERVWLANQTVIAPLMENFLKISANFIMVAKNANEMTDTFRDLEKNSGSLEKGFKSLIDFINQVVKATKEFYTTEAADELAGFISDVGKVIDAFIGLEKELEDAMRKVEDAINDAVENTHNEISTLGALPASSYMYGANTLQSFVNGLIDKEPALAAEMKNIADIIHGFLGVESPTELGPLSHLDEWPRNLIQSYSSGIEAEMHTLNSSFTGLTPGMDGGSASGGNRSIVINNTQYISDRATADYANRDLERLMHKHAVM